DLDGAAEPGVAAGLPKGDGAEHRADQRKRRLHGETAGIGGLPFREQCAVIERKSRRLLGEIDIESGAGKGGGHGQRKQPEDHDVILRGQLSPAISQEDDGRAQAALSSRLRLTISSAIWTVLSAAPLRKLSDTTQKERPLSTVWSSRMRLTKVA